MDLKLYLLKCSTMTKDEVWTLDKAVRFVALIQGCGPNAGHQAG